MEFQKYFQSYQTYFWQWEKDDYQYVITTSEGTSVAYAEYVFEILESLSLGATPPFGSLIMAIMVTNNNSGHFLGYLEKKLAELDEPSSFPNATVYNYSRAIRFLKNVAQLPDEYKTGEKRKQMLFSIFKDCHNGIKGSKMNNLITTYRNNPNKIDLCITKLPFNRGNYIKDVRTLAFLASKFPTYKSILDAILELPVEEIKQDIQKNIEELPSTEKPFDFVESLINNTKTFHVGSLIKRLWSGLKITMRHSSPSEQPLGGVSDITNKGDVNRLLLSEFANDDDVFMQRIANNEALYILREVPPESNQLDRILLLDASIKSWGNIRTINLAIALAIGKHPKTNFVSKIFALTHKADQIFYDNIHDIITGLGILSPTINCNEGIETYIQHNFDQNQELFFITSSEQLKQIEVQNILTKHQEKISYVIYTNEKGEIKIFRQLKTGKKHIQDLKLNLEELWTKPQNKADLPQNNVREPYENDLPILYPAQKSYTILECEGAFYKINDNNILYKFHNNDSKKGFEKIAHIPSYNFYFKSFLYKNEYNEMVLVTYTHQSFVFYNIQTQYSNTIASKKQNNLEFYLDKKIPYAVFSDKDIVKLSEKGIEKSTASFKITENHALNNFTAEYRSNRRISYDLLNEIKKVYIIGNDIYINDYSFYLCKFHKYIGPVFRISIKENNFIFISDLVLKRVGNNVLNAVKSIKDALNIGLGEARMIVEEGVGQNYYNKVLFTNKSQEELERYKTIIESSGCVCYIKTKYCETKDGSQIHLNDGVLKFISSDKKIPIFYIPFIKGKETAMATQEEFAGNTYFLPENSPLKVIDVQTFRTKYILPFLNHIIDNRINNGTQINTNS